MSTEALNQDNECDATTVKPNTADQNGTSELSHKALQQGIKTGNVQEAVIESSGGLKHGLQRKNMRMLGEGMQLRSQAKHYINVVVELLFQN